MDTTLTAARTYQVRTYGCQMNVHDSERIAGLLESHGYVAAGRRPAGRCGGAQHLRGPGERGQQAVRQPRPPGLGQAQPRGHADRRRRVPGAEGSRAHRGPGAVGRCGVRHAQRRRPTRPAPACVRDAGGAGRDRGVAADLPLDPAEPSRVRVRRVGGHQRRMQQHLHLLHRAQPARQGARPTSGRDPRRGRGAGRRRRHRGHPPGPERQRLRRGVR